MHYITCPTPVAVSTSLMLTFARKPGRLGKVARKGKEIKNKAASVANGLELLPLIIESSGRIGKPCDDFLQKFLKRYNSKDHESVYRA
jgi:hypothetical protein